MDPDHPGNGPLSGGWIMRRGRGVVCVVTVVASVMLAGWLPAEAYTPPVQPMRGTFTWTASPGGGYDVVLDMDQPVPPFTGAGFEIVDRVVVTGHALDIGACTPGY